MNRTRSIALLALAALLFAACGDDDDSDGGAAADGGGEAASCEAGETDGDLALYNWSEYIDPDLITAFEEEHDVTVTEDFYPSNEELVARIQEGAQFDLIVPSDYMVGIMIEEELIRPLDKEALPNLENLADRFASDLPYDPEGDYSVPYQWGTTGLGVNVDELGEDFPRSWSLVFDPEVSQQYAGQITMLDDPRETMGAALKYLGYSLNSTSEDELAEAEALVADAVGRLEYFVPEEGGTVWVDNMAVPTSASSPCTAHAFMNFLLDAERGAQLTNWNYYASPNEAAEEFIEPEVLEDPAIYPDDELNERLEFIEDTGDFEINYTDALTRARG